MPHKTRPRRAFFARSRALHTAALALFGLSLCGAGSWTISGCSGWDPRSPFERNAPDVDDAIKSLDAGKLESAEETLERYLGTGRCGDAGLQLPDSIRKKPSASFDLGLTLFYLAERFGQRFGDEEASDGGDEAQAAQRSAEIDCALIVVKAIASDLSVPTELRARARYLAGNLEFLRKKYEEAVKHYDQALELVPGMVLEAGGDGIGRDAAWNRAIALRRIEDQKDAGDDAEPDAPDASDGNDGDDGNDGNDGNDGSEDAPDGDDAAPDAPDSGEDGGDGGDAGGEDGGEDAGKGDAGADGGGDAGNDGGGDAGPSNEPKPEPKPQHASPQQDERMLDQLEEAPTYQEQEARAKAGVRRGRVMEDK